MHELTKKMLANPHVGPLLGAWFANWTHLMSIKYTPTEEQWKTICQTYERYIDLIVERVDVQGTT